MKLVFFSILVFLQSLSWAAPEVKERYSTTGLVYKKVPNAKYIDVVVVNFWGSKLRWRDLKETLKETQSHYQAAGINLNIVKAFEIKLRRRDQSLVVNELTGIDPASHIQPYEAIKLRGNRLPPKTRNVFQEISELVPNPDKTIFVTFFKHLAYQSHYTRNGERVLLNKGIQGFSFPPYGLGDHLPDQLKGFTAVVPNVSAKTISHELGHKLINVSHEGLERCPKFSGNGIPGLMGYGRSSTIYEGHEGRFHKERLHLSPFVYQTAKA